MDFGFCFVVFVVVASVILDTNGSKFCQEKEID